MRIFQETTQTKGEQTMSQARRVSDLPLLAQFKAFYRDIRLTPLHEIQDLYADDIVFIDPIHEIRGLASLCSYMEQMNAGVTAGRFEYLDQLVGNDSAYIKWDMHFHHPKLGSKMISVRGMTHIQFHERIYFHEDTYDLGAMLYEHVPIIRSGVRFIRNRLARQ